MTEAEWERCADPAVMLTFLHGRGRVDGRKLRLFAVACLRRVWDWIDERGRSAVATAERYADGRAGREELRAARLACKAPGSHAAWYAAASDPWVAARNAALSAQSGYTAGPALETERAAQAALLRDLVGNPLRPAPTIERARLTADAVALAAIIDEESTFERLPLLASLLAEAGCRSQEVEDHCRALGPHARGCWMLDLILNRTRVED
jgi:hypothetical protein